MSIFICSVMSLKGLHTMLNYGADWIRYFSSPQAGSQIRRRTSIAEVEDAPMA